ncbi:MAE_28990/MAE_18760 family HEPN-like nuclease [Burkholderia ubonensis]|uniref:MAE_28990/MAE_18760 family HEPN-like nuclease n=1 Tax=Burkholderia ubonensis TaxID=101571 RepID=UPI000ABE3FE5|nr:MAE_28990/MAE_18760 family HEPN-like nuclease [Burkholderia ubonensis]
MSVKTVDDFQLRIARELAWRKREISGLRLSARRSGSERGYLFRAGLVLLCAHWEGFLRNSVDLYFKHVFSQRLRLKELAPNFVAAAFFADVQRAGKADYPGSADTHGRLAQRILLGLDEIYTQSSWDIKTGGNPGTEVLARLLSSAGISPQLSFDAATWSTMKVFIDEQVVRDRHRIAHGEGFRLSQLEFLERSERMLGLLDRVSSELINAAEQKVYKAV